MNKLQKKLVEEYCEKYGGVDIKEGKGYVILTLNHDMITTEGLPYSWLEKFNQVFEDISVGMQPGIKCPDMYIHLHKLKKKWWKV